MLTFFFRTSSPALSTSATVWDHPLQLLPCWRPPLATLLYCEVLLPLFHVVALFNADLFLHRQLSSAPTLFNCLGSSFVLASPLDTPFYPATIPYCGAFLFCG